MAVIIVVLFIVGYMAIIFERQIKINKAASALLTGVLAWLVYFWFDASPEHAMHELMEQLSDLAAILFFLMAAMTIVEIIDGHQGFDVVTRMIRTKDKRKLLWLVSFVAFFMSALLDNMATTIVMVLLMRKLVTDKQERWIYIGMVVIAANSGGAWSPIGDVTTTMLWIGERISVGGIVLKTFIPSLISMIVPLAIVTFYVKGDVPVPVVSAPEGHDADFKHKEAHKLLVLCIGIAALLLVPVLKTIVHVPPVIGIFFGLGLMWVFVEILHREKGDIEHRHFSIQHAIKRMDMPSVLFFFGIILAIDAMKSAGVLQSMADWLAANVGDLNVIDFSIGIVSTVLDNIPLVAAVMNMYTFPIDDNFWTLLALCAGTGGSILIIGSAAGLAAMGMDRIDFFWYVKRISLPALLGYGAGVATFLGQRALLGF